MGDSDVLKEQAVKNAVMRYFADYAHVIPDQVVKEAADRTELDPMFVAQVVNKMVVEQLLELHFYHSRNTWCIVLDLTPPSVRYPKRVIAKTGTREELLEDLGKFNETTKLLAEARENERETCAGVCDKIRERAEGCGYCNDEAAAVCAHLIRERSKAVKRLGEELAASARDTAEAPRHIAEAFTQEHPARAAEVLLGLEPEDD